MPFFVSYADCSQCSRGRILSAQHQHQNNGIQSPFDYVSLDRTSIALHRRRGTVLRVQNQQLCWKCGTELLIEAAFTLALIIVCISAKREVTVVLLVVL